MRCVGCGMPIEVGELKVKKANESGWSCRRCAAAECRIIETEAANNLDGALGFSINRNLDANGLCSTGLRDDLKDFLWTCLQGELLRANNEETEGCLRRLCHRFSLPGSI